MKQILFWIVLGAILLDTATIVLSILKPHLRVWPPPRRDSWQYYYNGAMSYTGLLGFVALGILDFNSFRFDGWAHFFVGGLLFSCGFFALWGFRVLGTHASQGLGDELITTGPYRYSRNPQYVGTIPAILGFAIVCNSTLALVTAPLLSVWFILVPFAEESWCREKLGAAYEEYAATVPRFLAIRRLLDRVRSGRSAHGST